MATVTAPELPGLAGDEVPVDLTADLFLEMIEAGLFPPDRRVFLWDGRLCEKMAKTVAHAATVVAIHEALRRRLPDDWILWPENPIALDATHVPLPDVPIVRGPLHRHIQQEHHPHAVDIGLIVEVTVSSLWRDLGERARIFATAWVPNYWVADVLGRRIVEHSQPQIIAGVGSYGQVQSHTPGGEIPLVLDGRDVALIPVAELLPVLAP